MKVKLRVKAKSYWSQYHRDLIKGAVDWAIKYHGLQGQGKLIVSLTCANDDGYAVTTREGKYHIWISSKHTVDYILKIVFHEMTHVKQFIFDGFDLLEGGEAYWQDRVLHYNEENYWDYPWEVEARKYERLMLKEYKNAKIK